MALVRIKYKGLSDVRVINKKDAASVGVTLSQDLVWDRIGARAGGNIPGVKRPDFPNAARGIVVDGLSDDLLAALKSEGTFTITEINDDNTDGDDIITGEALDDTGSAVVDATTGQKSVKGESNADADPVPSGTAAGGSAPTGSTGKGSSTGGTAS
jgi:hypothetical protein